MFSYVGSVVFFFCLQNIDSLIIKKIGQILDNKSLSQFGPFFNKIDDHCRRVS